MKSSIVLEQMNNAEKNEYENTLLFISNTENEIEKLKESRSEALKWIANKNLELHNRFMETLKLKQ